MVLRHSMVFGIGLVLAAAPAFGQAPPTQTPVRPAPPTKPVTVAQPTRVSPSSATRPKADPSEIGVPHTLAEALAATYSNQPALQAERAKLRATDENVPQALAGWRPTVIVAGTAGYGDGVSRTYSGTAGQTIKSQSDRLLGTAQATLTQPIYSGGKQQATINRAKNQVMAERATLIGQEQTSFGNTVSAYVGVIQAQQLLALNINNEQVLAKQLQATNDRFRVGEITRTDVAQAEAALAGATAQRQTSAGNLQTARGTFQQIVGFLPPSDLVEPQPLALPVKTEQDATAMAANNNPTVVAALFNDAAAKDAVDVAFAQLLPSVSIKGQVFRCRSTKVARSIPRSARRARRRNRPGSWLTMHAVLSCRTRCRPGKHWLRRRPPLPARASRSVPTRLPWKVWSARPSSAVAPRSTC